MRYLPSSRFLSTIETGLLLLVRPSADEIPRLPRQASQQYLLTGLLRCPVCGCRMGGKARKDRSRSYRCCGVNLGANAPVPGCAITALADQVEQAVLAEVLPLIEGAVSSLPELRQALERAWAALRTPATLQDELQERQRQQLVARGGAGPSSPDEGCRALCRRGHRQAGVRTPPRQGAGGSGCGNRSTESAPGGRTERHTCRRWRRCLRLPKGGERRCVTETSRRSVRCWRHSSSGSCRCGWGVARTTWRSYGPRLAKGCMSPLNQRGQIVVAAPPESERRHIWKLGDNGQRGETVRSQPPVHDLLALPGRLTLEAGG